MFSNSFMKVRPVFVHQLKASKERGMCLPSGLAPGIMVQAACMSRKNTALGMDRPGFVSHFKNYLWSLSPSTPTLYLRTQKTTSYDI